jgi:hypothetical protein
MYILYWAYVNVFWCLRRVHKLFGEEQTPVEIQAHNATWLSVDATFSNGTTQDMTEVVRETFRHDALLTPDILARATRLDDVVSWRYMTTALEYKEIQAEGVVNGL